jgi:hypothetical protein
MKITIEEIINLINSKKEGVNYDFKECHHANKVDLIHDVICLANADYEGARFLIFGVSDSYDICGIASDEKRKTQSDIINVLRDANFCSDIYPDISLEEINFSDYILDILVIKNTLHKPYYLTKDKSHQGRHIRAGTIYSRIMDTNTPQNSVASPIHIEKMWKEKFGLTQTAIERLKLYLNNYNDWDNKDDVYFHKNFPEFTIRNIEHNSIYDGNETREWARGEIGYHYASGNHTRQEGFFYHGTLMVTLLIVVFDGGKKIIVNPDWEPIVNGRIYHYLLDSLDYIYQKFISREHGDNDYSEGLNFSSSSNKSGRFSIPIFENKQELSKFKEFAQNVLKTQEERQTISDYEEQNKYFYELLDVYNQFQISKNK